MLEFYALKRELRAVGIKQRRITPCCPFYANIGPGRLIREIG